jgi:ribokinase
MTSDVVVVGSVNLDIVIGVSHHPRPGETVVGGDRNELQGGKGANQAVAAARLGRAVTFVGRVGDDDAGTLLREGLRAEGVDVAHLRTDPAAPSGVALIAVDERGENTIIVSPGANARVDRDDVAAAADALAGAAVTLVQHEVSADAVLAAARAAGGTVVLNPAPARAVDPALRERADVLVPNRGELAFLAGRDGDPEDLARGLHDAVVVTLGAEGALVVHGGRTERIPAPAVDVVDTTGAGDAFCGALADALARGAALVEAARWAVAAAARSVTAPGARGGMPTAAQLAG